MEEVISDTVNSRPPSVAGTTPASPDRLNVHSYSQNYAPDITETKGIEIAAACGKGDTQVIERLATTEGGLLTDNLRQKAWPILLGCSNDKGLVEATRNLSHPVSANWKELPKHKDEDQVCLDVNRSFIYYPNNESEAEIDARKIDLSDVILETLRRHPMLCYFQGFHDIVQVFLLVMGKDAAVDAVARLSLLRIRDFMLPSLSPSLAHLQLLPAILYSVDRELCEHVSQTQPFFALAATLTLYAHEIQDYGEISRLFDFLLAQEAAVSVYLFAVIILSRRKELFAIPADEPEMLHFTLSKLPQPLRLESLITRTVDLFASHPPEKLPSRAWSKISSDSVLKTTKVTHGIIDDSLKCRQSIADGEAFFANQVAQLRRQELKEQMMTLILKNRRTIGTVGLAVLVGGLSIWIRRRGYWTLSDLIFRVWSQFDASSKSA